MGYRESDIWPIAAYFKADARVRASLWRAIKGAAILGLLAPGLADAASTSSTAQQSSSQAQLSAVDSIATQIAILRSAAEQWATVNITSTWNQSQSTTANPFGTNPPALLYVGPHPSLCGAPAVTSQTIDLIAAGFVTPNFSTPYSGEYCAMIYPNSGSATQAGPVGANGGTDIVPVTTVLAYFVAGSSADPAEILHNATSDYAISHIAPLLQNNFAQGGTVQKYTPVITNAGTGASTWQGAQP